MKKKISKFSIGNFDIRGISDKISHILLDRMVGDFIKENPETTVINIACGMDTRVYRVDNGKVHWYNIDLPETIGVRERFLNESDRICMIAKSAMDESWAEVVGKQKGKVLVVIEGLTMYLTEGMKVMYPAYGLIGWIPAVQNIANRLVVLRKGM